MPKTKTIPASLRILAEEFDLLLTAPGGVEEMRELVADKETVARSSRCPHGRPTTIVFSMGELEKQFKRTGF